MPPTSYTIAVRTLCEFSARTGDLDLRFALTPSGAEGQTGHATVAARRPAGYQTEISLTGTHETVRVRGRADGYDPVRHRLEEIKTHRGNPAAIPQNQRALHWAQARIYAHLLCEKLQTPAIEIALVYFDIATQNETVLTESRTAEDLRDFFQTACDRFQAWANSEIAHRAARDRALAALRFPYDAFRPGQRQLATAVYRAVRDGKCLMAQAPTGIGKTMATLFAALKAAPGRLDNVFFLCAKTAGRQLAIEALARLRQAHPGLPLRIVELQARDRACVHPDKACHGGSCPLARGFYDRLPAAREAALQEPAWDAPAVRRLAQAHEICPYFLSQELARWSDVAIGDYHYYFDHHGMLHGMAQANQWRTAILVDEAHNLLERGRRMASAELALSDVRRVRRAVPRPLRRRFTAIAAAWRKTASAAAPSGASAAPASPRHTQAANGGAYIALPEPPPAIVQAVEQAVAAIAEYLATLGRVDADDEKSLLQFYFDALRWLRVAEQRDADWVVDLMEQRGVQPRGQALCIRNVVPAPWLAPRFATAHAVVLFSATLSPGRFYADMLGVPADTACVDVPPPFDPARLAVRVVGDVSTRYAERRDSLAPIAALMAREYAKRPGNYLCFASSFEYLNALYAQLRDRHPAVPAWIQTAGMSELERGAFLERFQADGQGIGFAVLGGAFGEGIDLPGKRLIGAFIVTLGLPQVGAVNDRMKQCMQERFGPDLGYAYAYLYPGMQKIVQAAGRVIRSESDEGSVYLIDARYARAAVRRLLPAWWRLAPLRAQGGAG
ncbi:ATP-dependent DNA helicase [Bordetella genomosp. 9]|uniref:ATP-dependent DNA helicase n=1 Tax=Bordetella genomosp. 9 TaxID=1416803 RepID=A0A1W6Z0F9_9BORD|nr:ATP-dependent DNA helicase [Bordetella genomosp. 9]ARP86609.1 ATP-dependent DNA helicase [Bordetella genomosp. 9]